MEKPMNLNAQPMDMSKGLIAEGKGESGEGGKGEKLGQW